MKKQKINYLKKLNIFQNQVKKTYKHKESWFTLVELIIVITVLAILATIVFVSFQSFTKDARDWNRVATFANVQKWLDIYIVQNWKAPEPDGTILSWSLNWVPLTRVWIIWDKISRIIKTTTIPTDPLSKNNYLYWISSDNKYYQIWWTLEGLQTYNVTPKAYANNWSARAKVVWSYSYPLKLNWITYSLPSLLFIWNWWDLNDSNAKFIIDKWENIPYTLSNETLNNTKTITENLEKVTWNWWLTLKWSNISNLTKEDINNWSPSAATIMADLWITKDQLYVIVFWSSNGVNTTPQTPTYNNCGGWTQNWYTYTSINHNQTLSVAKSESITNWNKNYWAEAVCNNWNITITNELSNISCNSWYVEQWLACIQDICWWNVPTNWHSTATSQTVWQSWNYTTTPWICSFICDTNYTYNSTDKTCKADTKTTSCTWLPTNAIWNTTNSITQTWNWTNWLPLEAWAYNTTSSTTNCNYKCWTNYHTEDGWVSCVSDTRSCVITNWIWQQTWGWSSWWTCSVVSCNSWHIQSWNNCNATWTFTLSNTSVTLWTSVTISNNCSIAPTSYNSSDSSVATIAWTTITTASVWTTNITPVWWSCADSSAKALTITAIPNTLVPLDQWWDMISWTMPYLKANRASSDFSCVSWNCTSANWNWIVYDSKTQLYWQANAWVAEKTTCKTNDSNATYENSSNGRDWVNLADCNDGTANDDCNLCAAAKYCYDLYLWWDRWRLPDSTELASIIDFTYTNSTYRDDSFFTSQAGNYWTSTTDSLGRSYVLNGSIISASAQRSSDNYVRCVKK